MNNELGAVYVATGKNYTEMAAMSAKSLKTHCPEIRVHIFTDCDIDSYGCFDSSTKISDPHIRSKVDYIYDTPYQRTLFLDADTRICEDITPMFDLLNRFDIALAYDYGRGRQRQKTLNAGQASFLPMNSGVILYKSTEPVIKFLKTWQKAYHNEGSKHDQYTLRKLLWLSDLKVWVLAPEYNCRPKSCIKALKSAEITPKILHLNEFKEEADIPPIGLLPLRQKIKRIIKHNVISKIKMRLTGLPF